MVISNCVRGKRAAVVICAALLTMVGSREASASAGCSAAEAEFALSAGAGETKTSNPVTGFVKDDTIVFNVAINNIDASNPSGMWVLKDTIGAEVASIRVGGTNQATYKVKGTTDTTLIEVITGTEVITGQNPVPPPIRGTVSVTVISCTNTATPGPTTTDSQKARTVQILGSRLVSQVSGAAITGAMDGAIAEGLSGGNSGAPDSGLAPPFGLGAGSEQMSRLGAFASPHNVGSALREWKPWAIVRGSGWDQDDPNPKAGSINGNQINATFGAGRLLQPGVLVGVAGGYENFRYAFDSINGRLQGDGWTVGAYAGWASSQHLRFDVMGAWTGLSYDTAAGIAAGSFTANRWLISTGVTGTHQMNAFVLEPSSRLYAMWERQDAWTDSLGTSQAERSFSLGRISTGARVAYPWQLGGGTTAAPYVGLFGDYRFSSDEALPVNQPFVGLSDGWSARGVAGVIMSFTGGRLSLEGELGGIGSGDQLRSLSVRGSIPFN